MRPTLTPTVRKVYHDDGTSHAEIVSPPELAGRHVVRVDGHACNALTPNGRCGLISGHHGLCWDCSVELIAAAAPWAVVSP